jgi:hypothetical protein
MFRIKGSVENTTPGFQFGLQFNILFKKFPDIFEIKVIKKSLPAPVPFETPWLQCYKTFYGCNLRMFVTSWVFVEPTQEESA